ncbi:hypothetical protein H6P81_008565 [Aristolochia fimbriata]|uniref:FHA domain-containing protein n=1 Tax=Aristolochia fimbriata TaxID=158543 RepID=A0AAV7EKI9_ARIFI|nr:hypothetical protein H6P81_008565 [Aristolochia fimbriata]
MKVPMGPPPLPRSASPPKAETESSSDAQTPPRQAEHDNNRELVSEPAEKPSSPERSSASGESKNVSVPYSIPPWSEPPCHSYSLEVLKDGLIVDQFDVSAKGAYMFGRVDLCDFVLEHPTISRFHAVLQFKGSGDAYIYDLGSTHGTFINKNQIKKRIYAELHVGDVIRFGHSSRLYLLQGPSELMPPERDITMLRKAKLREHMQDREASLLRAKVEASLADGISWGMKEDAFEEVTEEDVEEVTWQTYQGQLTEKQEKTRSKILKRMEKVANMKKEIDAIRAKDIAQGGLTQGQQTQIARNEQRISQIIEELESLEETLNESIQESIGARTKITYGKKRATAEDESDDALSDDDDFYDRTKKLSIAKAGEQQKIETADSLLDKKDAMIKEIEMKKDLLAKENSKMDPEADKGDDDGDALDAYMTGLSSQIVRDAASQLLKDIAVLQSDLDRVLYLLKIADPAGEAAQRRESKALRSGLPEASAPKSKKSERKRGSASVKPENSSSKDKPLSEVKDETSSKDKPVSDQKHENSVPIEKVGGEKKEGEDPVKYTMIKPVRLGATVGTELKDNQPKEAEFDMHDSDGFIGYKDRKAFDNSDGRSATCGSTLADAGPGLIIRKRKEPEKPERVDKGASEVSTSSSAESAVADAVALLLRHERGYTGLDGEDGEGEKVNQSQKGQFTKEKPKSKRVLGPERPAFLGSDSDCEPWVPPQGQSGDGRTSLNDRYGY